MVIITLINYSNSTASFCILSCFRKGSKVKTPLMQIRFFRILSIPTISVLHRASQDSSYERKDLCSFLPETCPSVVLDVERETRSKKKKRFNFSHFGKRNKNVEIYRKKYFHIATNFMDACLTLFI